MRTRMIFRKLRKLFHRRMLIKLLQISLKFMSKPMLRSVRMLQCSLMISLTLSTQRSTSIKSRKRLKISKIKLNQ
jgi:hypothetical protein